MVDGGAGAGAGRRVKVANLAEGLRKLADTLEANQALYDPVAFEREAGAMAEGFRSFLQREPELHRVAEKSFLECRAAWLQAWQHHPDAMTRRCEEVTGRLPHRFPDESEIGWRLQLLVEALARLGGTERVLALTEMPASGDIPAGQHVEDTAATEALLLWGQMTQEEFLLAWGRLDPELVQRCASLVGVTLTRPTLAAKRKLHAQAVRLFRNTRM